MSNIDTRTSFFPRGRSPQAESAKSSGQISNINRNSNERAIEITDKTADDAKVSIPDGVKDFSRIKKAAMSAPEPDNSEKIARLKAQIQDGTYNVDYDELANKILSSEF
jgi:negative regulator of flagellin synthesis FlgM